MLLHSRLRETFDYVMTICYFFIRNLTITNFLTAFFIQHNTHLRAQLQSILWEFKVSCDKGVTKILKIHLSSTWLDRYEVKLIKLDDVYLWLLTPRNLVKIIRCSNVKLILRHHFANRVMIPRRRNKKSVQLQTMSKRSHRVLVCFSDVVESKIIIL